MSDYDAWEEVTGYPHYQTTNIEDNYPEKSEDIEDYYRAQMIEMKKLCRTIDDNPVLPLCPFINRMRKPKSYMWKSDEIVHDCFEQIGRYQLREIYVSKNKDVSMIGRLYLEKITGRKWPEYSSS